MDIVLFKADCQRGGRETTHAGDLDIQAQGLCHLKADKETVQNQETVQNHSNTGAERSGFKSWLHLAALEHHVSHFTSLNLNSFIYKSE